MEPAQAVTEALDRLLATGRVEVRENDAWLAALEGFRYEVRQQGDVLLLHLWSEKSNLVRRVLRIKDDEPGRLTVEAARFGRTRPDRMEFVSAESQPLSGRLAREQFRARFRELLAQQFPDETQASLATSADLKHSLSGNYTRGVLDAGSHAWAVLGAAPNESAATYDAFLTFGLLWLDRARNSKKRRTVVGLRLFFPEGSGSVTAHRLQALSPSTVVQLYEYSPATWRARRVDPRDLGNLDTWLAPSREIEAALAQAAPAVERIRRLVPGAIETEVIPGTNEVALRFRGLLFARWQGDNLFYGLGDSRRPFTSSSEHELMRLVRELEKYRSPVASAKHHPMYRAQPERWLQSLVAADPARVDARLDPRFLYAQVPAFSAGDRGVMDLLGVTRGGRLAVLELKASEDIQLILQTVDYWLRVRWHLAQQDFSRYGYFPGVSLDPRPPLLFVVAPSLQFHPAGDVLLRYLNEEIEICRVGVSESWRRGLKVVLRQTGR